MKPAKKAAKTAKKAAPAKGGKPSATKTAKRYVPPGKLAKKAAKAAKPSAKKAVKVAAKKAPVKVATKKAPKLPAKKVAAIAKQVNAATKPAQETKGLKVVTGHKAGTLPGDVTENGVLRPRDGTQARALWDLCDKLKKDLKRPPARFEFRQAIQDMKGTDGKSSINPDSASFQYFAWRKFHGVKGRSLGIYPKRNTFEANIPAPAPAKVPKAPKPPVTPAKPAKAAKPAPKPAPAKKAAKVAKKAAPKGKVSIDTPPATEAPKVSDRAAKASQAAKTGGLVVTPPTELAEV